MPAVRTLGRILERRGVLDRRRRVRRPPPPPGWYLPAVAPRHAELDSADIVEGLHIRGGPDVEVLTVISLHGGLVGAWPTLRVTAKTVVDTLLAHWRNAVRRERPLMRFLLGLTFPLVLDPDRKINVRYGVIGVAVVGTQRPIRSWCSCSWPWAAAGRR